MYFQVFFVKIMSMVLQLLCIYQHIHFLTKTDLITIPLVHKMVEYLFFFKSSFGI